MFLNNAVLVSLLTFIVSYANVSAQEPLAPTVDEASAPSHQEDFPLWAYGYIVAPSPPEDWSQECLDDRPRDCDRPGGMPSDTSGTLMRVEGSDLAFTQSQITAPFAPAD